MSAAIIPRVAGLRILRIDGTADPVTVWAAPTAAQAQCPQCGTWSRRVHSHYGRRVRGRPWGAVGVVWRLIVRRFRCPVPTCPQTIFCERLGPAIGRSARWTAEARAWLTAWAWVGSAADAARVFQGHGLPVSPDTLNRWLRTTPDPAAAAVQVLGVDEWARRRGVTYATILVDHEAGRVVDVLPDDHPETVAAWLRQHPTIRVVTRDRDAAFAKAIAAGAPQAHQIADRFHLVQNLGDAVERFFQRVRPPEAPDLGASAPASPTRGDDTPPARPSPGHQRRIARWQAVQDRVAAGTPLSQVARELGLDRKTVRAYAQQTAPPVAAGRRLPVPPSLAPWAAQLEALWAQGVGTAPALYAALQASGYRGSLSSCSRWLRARRGPRAAAAPRGLAPIPARRWAAWCGQRWPRLSRQTTRPLSTRLEDPAVRRVWTLVHQFHTLVRHRRGTALPAWLRAAEASAIPELQRFAQGLRKDLAAVTAAVTEPWSQGRTEGFNHKIKRLKRLMYGRANFDLLRARILHSPSA